MPKRNSVASASLDLASGPAADTFDAMVRYRDFALLLVAFLALGSGLLVFVRLALRSWWTRPRVRRGAWILVGLDLAVPTIWFALTRLGATDVADSLVTWQLALFFGQHVIQFGECAMRSFFV